MSEKWKQFTETSDRNYRDTRKNGDFDQLKAHNILKDGNIEFEFISEIVKAFFGKEMPKGTALDVCCGVGYMSNCLANFGYSVTAFDLNSDAISIAKERCPSIDFFVDDAADPSAKIIDQTYDLILIREAHPFSRISDPPLQEAILKTYLSILNKSGVLILAHARRGGGMSYPSVCFNALQKIWNGYGFSAIGPFYFFIFKHFKPRLAGRVLIKIQSFLSALISKLTGSRWIEFFIIHKNNV